MATKVIITSASNKFFPSLLNLLGSIKENYPEHPEIKIYDLGLNPIFVKFLQKIDKVEIMKVPHFTEFWRSCYTWKPYIFNNPIADLNFYLDAGSQILKPLDEIFEKVDAQEYLIVSGGNEVKNKDLIPTEYLKIFDIENEKFLESGILAAGFFGFKSGSSKISNFTDILFKCAKAGLCLGFSKHEQWKNKGVNKNYFIRDAKYFRHDNTLYCILVNKIIRDFKTEPLENFDAMNTKKENQLIWNIRMSYKDLKYIRKTKSRSNIFLQSLVYSYIKIFFLAKEINRIIKGNNYGTK